MPVYDLLGGPLIQGGTRRDADTTPAADGGTHPLYTNATGRLKVSTHAGAYDPVTGSIVSAASSVVADVSRASNVMVFITGTYTGVNVTFEISPDGTNWFGTQAVRTNANTVESTSGVIATGLTYGWELSVNATNNFRVRATAWGTGTAQVQIIRGSFATEPIPALQSHGITGTVTTSLTSTTLTAVTPGTAATNLGKAEDAVHTSGDVGVMALAVRNDDGATTPASATGDYSALSVGSKGEQFVRDLPTTTPTITRVGTSTTSASLLASSAGRRAALIFNESANTLYVKFGATASATSYTVQVPPNQYYEVPAFYTGAIDGILNTGTGNAQITSLV